MRGPPCRSVRVGPVPCRVGRSAVRVGSVPCRVRRSVFSVSNPTHTPCSTCRVVVSACCACCVLSMLGIADMSRAIGKHPRVERVACCACWVCLRAVLGVSCWSSMRVERVRQRSCACRGRPCRVGGLRAVLRIACRVAVALQRAQIWLNYIFGSSLDHFCNIVGPRLSHF